MGLFGSLGKSISKGFDAGSHTALGPVGGLLGAIGGGVTGLFGHHPGMGQPGGNIVVGDAWRNTFPTMQQPQTPQDDMHRQLLMRLAMMNGGQF
jgi:hypothetical protein